MKIQKKKYGGRGERGVGLGGQGGCNRRIEVFGKIHTQKKNQGRFVGVRVGGVRVDVNEELKFGGPGGRLGAVRM